MSTSRWTKYKHLICDVSQTNKCNVYIVSHLMWKFEIVLIYLKDTSLVALKEIAQKNEKNTTTKQ